MATPEPAAQPELAQESSASSAPAAEPVVPEAAATARAEAAENEREELAEKTRAEAGKVEGEGEGEEDEEEGECGFCLFMKAGGCKDAFVAWEECVEASQKEGSDMVERCYEATSNLKKCMDAHADYYAPVLQAEEAVNERAEAEAAAAAAAAEAAKDAGAEKKDEAAPQQPASAPPADGEVKEGEAAVDKV